MLEQIFLEVMDMSRAASLVIVFVFLIRILLKRFPKYLSYMLWGVVLFRLLCPVTLESRISPIPNLDPVFYEYLTEKDAVSLEIEGALSEATVLNTGNETKSVPETAPISPATFQQTGNVNNAEVPLQELFILFGKYVWISGIGIMLLYCAVSTAKIRKKVSISIPFKKIFILWMKCYLRL